MELLFLYWGLYGWGVFVLVVMVLVYFVYCYNLLLVLCLVFYLLIGKCINGLIGYMVDCFGIIVMVFGFGVDMGFGVFQFNFGLDYLYVILYIYLVQMVFIVLMMGVVILVVVFGVDKGICIFFDINMLLVCSLLLFVLFVGLIQYLFNILVQNVGDYFGYLLGKSFDFYVYGGFSDWLGLWMVFYWVWWIVWVFFVGLFIVCILCGWMICEFVFGVLFILFGFILVWMLIFGNSVLEQVFGGVSEFGWVVIEQLLMVFYQMFQNYFWSCVVIIVMVLVSFVFFVILVDFGIVVFFIFFVYGGSVDDDGLKWLWVFWGLVIVLVIGGLLFVGSIDVLKLVVVLIFLFFLLILLLMMWGLYKVFYMELQCQWVWSYFLVLLMSGNGKCFGGWK